MRAAVTLSLVLFAACAKPPPAPDAGPLPPAVDREGDLAAARALFERNLEAIQKKDRDAYLGCYRADDALVRAGPAGPRLGFADLASGTSSTAAGWPEFLAASDLQVHWLAPGWVYGSYRYRVVFDGAASEGLSERIFARRNGQWEIVVSTAFGAPASSDPRLADVAFLEGTWVEQKDGVWTEEIWSPARGGVMMGSGRTIVDGQARSFEHLRIEHTPEGLELIAMPGGTKATRFRLEHRSTDSVVFANAKHDFPQRISYRLERGRLTARAEGRGHSVTWTYLRQ